jgi:hypothetical protein
VITMDVADLRSARQTGRVAYLRLIQSAGQHPDKLFCFFEGEDVKYYGPLIEEHYGKFVNLSCGGKREVLKALDLVRHAGCFSDVRTAFFIDRDFDDSLRGTDPDLFETDCYSIENYYITANALERILRAEFGVDVDNPEYAVIQRLFSSLKTEFFKHVHLLNAWIYYQRKVAKLDGQSLYLSRINMRNYLSFTLGGVKGAIGIEEIKGIYPETKHPSEAEIANAMEVLSPAGAEKRYRGKLNIEFYFTFLMLLKNEAAKGTHGVFTTNRKVKLSCSKQNILSELCAYADRPAELFAFIDKFRRED